MNEEFPTEPILGLNKEGKPRQRAPKRETPETGMTLATCIEPGPYSEKALIFDCLIQWHRMNERRREADVEPPMAEVTLTELAKWLKIPLMELRTMERSTEFTNLLLRDAKKGGVRSVVKLQPLVEKILKEKLKSKDPKIQKEGLQEQREWLTILGIKEVDSTPLLEDEGDAQKLIDEQIALWRELTNGFKDEPSPTRYISTLLSRGTGANREQSDAGKELSQQTKSDS